MATNLPVANEWIASKAGWTTYDGLAVTGWPIALLFVEMQLCATAS